MNDAAREDAFESMRLRLKDMSKSMSSMRAVAAIHRSKKLKAETELEEVVVGMKRMNEELKCVCRLTFLLLLLLFCSF